MTAPAPPAIVAGLKDEGESGREGEGGEGGSIFFFRELERSSVSRKDSCVNFLESWPQPPLTGAAYRPPVDINIQ